ncbi:MAG: OmpA family protein [Azonexus sp.]|nr:OmpA family protein [Azonexus sp.]
MPDKGVKPDAIIKLRAGSSSLSPEMQLRLRRVADSIAGDDRVSIRLVGYVPEGGSSAWNIGEAERSLRVVKQYLEKLRVPSRRIQTASFGDEHKSVARRNRDWVEVYILRPVPPILVR